MTDLVDEVRTGAGKGFRLAVNRPEVLSNVLAEWRYGSRAGPSDRGTIRATVRVSNASSNRIQAEITTPHRLANQRDTYAPTGNGAATLDTPAADKWLRDAVLAIRETGALAAIPLLVLVDGDAVLSESARLRATLGKLAKEANATVALVSEYDGLGGAALIPAFGAPTGDANEWWEEWTSD